MQCYCRITPNQITESINRWLYYCTMGYKVVFQKWPSCYDCHWMWHLPCIVGLCVSGMHNKQFYVQASRHMRDKMASASERYRDENLANTCRKDSSIPRVAWKPYLNTGGFWYNHLPVIVEHYFFCWFLGQLNQN